MMGWFIKVFILSVSNVWLPDLMGWGWLGQL